MNQAPQRREKTTDTFKVMARFWVPGTKRTVAPPPLPNEEEAKQMTAPIATFPADAAHADAGALCLAALAANGIGARQEGNYFPVILVWPADSDQAKRAIAHEIETSDLQVRLIERTWGFDSEQIVGYYRDDDAKDGGRARKILLAHQIHTSGTGGGGTISITSPPERAAEARRLIFAAIKAEGLHVTISPAMEQKSSPGQVCVLTHRIVPADQSPSGREVHHLSTRQDIEVEPLTFTSKGVWDFKIEADAIAAAWSPDAHFLLFTATRADGMKLYAVDFTKPKAKEMEIALPASGISPQLDLGKIEWPSAEHALFPAVANSGEQWALDLAAVPRLSLVKTKQP